MATINSTLDAPIQGIEASDQVWDTAQLREDFEVLSFLAPFVEVRRKSDGKRGTLQFQPSPRYYYAFVEEA